MMSRLYLVHPFLFAMVPAVFLWGQNFGEVPLREALPTLIALLVFGGVVMLLLRVFFRDLEKLVIVSSVLLVGALLFGYLYDIFFDTALFQIRFRFAFLILFLVFAVVWYFVRKTSKDLSNLNKAIAVGVVVFIALSLTRVAWGYYGTYRNSQENTDDVVSVATGQGGELRDIYYIILDGYSSPEVVKNVIGLDEIDNMTSYLRQNGFFIAENSRSNYPWTLLSIPSSLNMRYLDDPSADKRQFTLAENHKVKDILKSYGYRYIHFGADAFTYFNRYADKNINVGFLSPYQTALWHNTIFRPIQDLTGTRFEGLGERFGFLDSRKVQWERERFKLARLKEISNEEQGPIFVFAHFLIPKGDYVFDENGDFVTHAEAIEKGNRESYLDQVKYINKEIEDLVDVLLDESEPKPIIIFQGDHGFAFYNNRDVLDDFANPERARELVVPGKYSFPIFNAYHFPAGGDRVLYDSISPVNTFRVLFNYYFDQDLEILEDVSYTVDIDDDSKFILWDRE